MHIQSFGCLRRVKVCIYQRVDQFFTAVLHIFRQNLSIYIKDMIQFILWYDRLNEITDMIVNRDHLTTLMITHNMQSALDLGNRILMMDSGDIVLDIHEEEKKGLTVEGLLEKFKTGAGKMLDNDRILLSGEK